MGTVSPGVRATFRRWNAIRGILSLITSIPYFRYELDISSGVGVNPNLYRSSFLPYISLDGFLRMEQCHAILKMLIFRRCCQIRMRHTFLIYIVQKKATSKSFSYFFLQRLKQVIFIIDLSIMNITSSKARFCLTNSFYSKIFQTEKRSTS